MPTDKVLKTINVFPDEETFEQNEASLQDGEISLVPVRVVKTINGAQPDAAGNVQLQGGGFTNQYPIPSTRKGTATKDCLISFSSVAYYILKIDGKEVARAEGYHDSYWQQITHPVRKGQTYEITGGSYNAQYNILTEIG